MYFKSQLLLQFFFILLPFELYDLEHLKISTRKTLKSKWNLYLKYFSSFLNYFNELFLGFIIILSQDLFIQYSPDCIYIKVVTFKKSNYSVLLEARLHFSEFLSNMSNVKTTGIHYSKTNGLNYNTHDTPMIHVVLKTNRILLNLVSSIYLCILLC